MSAPRAITVGDPLLQRLAVTALTIFNDVIIREAFLAGVPLLDLRLICSEDADYANEIEPSVAGGEKITGAILKLIADCDFLSGGQKCLSELHLPEQPITHLAQSFVSRKYP